MTSGRTVAAAACAFALCAAGARADRIERTAIGLGDTVLADTLLPGEIDEYLVPAPRGASLRFELRKSGPGNWRPRYAIFDDDYQGIAYLPTASPVTAPLGRSGDVRLVLGSADGTAGAYRLRATARPQRTAATAGTTEAGPPLVVGVFAGSKLDVTIRWRGPAPVTLVSFVGSDGAPLGGADAAVTRGSSSSQKGFEAPVFGDCTATFDVPAGTKSWSASVRIVPPRLPPGIERDLRTDGVPPPPGVELPPTSSLPVVLVLGESGGPNDVLFFGGDDIPGVVALAPGSETGPCAYVDLPGGELGLRCRSGYSARFDELVEGGDARLASFAALDVRTPHGTGSVRVSGVSYDAASGLPSAWREERTFDATGRTHVLEVTDVRRFGNRVVKSFVVEHTPPGGPTRRYHYGLSFQ